ncbi:MAG: prepilin peptidase [Bdellovibrionales bacterium]|nr:prepilin peptidase [Bdellovibrionales bacterium]
MDTWFIFSIMFLLGLVVGSFSNVLIYRVPLRGNIAWPGSACPKCKIPIKWRDNIPLLSWVILRGKCRSCHQAISWRYPLVELICGLLLGFLFLRLGLCWTLLEYSVFCIGLVVVSFIDIEYMIIPDVFTWPGMFLGLVGAALSPERSFSDSFAGLALGFGFLWAIAYIYVALRKEEGMGGGDIKLIGWIGAVLGWQSIPFVILVSSIIGSFAGILFALKTRGSLKSTIPFGPYLALASLLYIFGGESIGHWYLRLFLPGLLSPN